MEAIDFLDEMEVVKSGFIWETANKEKLRIDQMSTKHIFNAMKMVYNHIAEVVQLPVLPTIWYHHRYSKFYYKAIKAPRWMLKHLVIFIYEIEIRKNLPEEYRVPYDLIIAAILNSLKIKNDPEMIKEMWMLLPERGGD